MKHKLLFSLGLFFALAANAQTIPNGGFENWTNNPYEDPQFFWQTSNMIVASVNLPYNVLKVSDPQQGTYAMKMNTVTNGMDTMFGFITNGDPTTLAGGIPYSQHPSSLTGYYKSTIMPGDTGLLICIFKQGGIPISTDVQIFVGTHSTYTPFALSVNLPPLSTPDTVIIAAASSNAFSTNGIPGSMLQLDNLSFTGVLIQPAQLNGSFENWDAHSRYSPVIWTTAGDSVVRTTDAHSGTYALELNTINYNSTQFGPSYLSNGYFPPNQGPVGGRPYSLMNDTLCGWYKFIPTGTDSATVYIGCTQNGNQVGGGIAGLPPASSYTFFSVPIANGLTPDTMLLIIASSFVSTNANDVGSVLKVDDLYLKSSPAAIAEIHWNDFGLVKLYPNPSSGDCWIEFDNRNTENVMLIISDELGRTVSEETISGIGNHREHIDTSVLNTGVYTVTLLQDGKKVSRKLIVQ
jgi:hypothetical protein